MTEGYQPPTSRRGNSEQDTATLPRVTVPGTSGGSGGQRGGSGRDGDGWSPVSRTESGANRSAAAENPRPATGPAGGIGAKLSQAASTVAAGATSAASTAKTAIKSAANEAESRAGRPPTGRPARGARQPRRARLTLSHINVYSVFKFSCVLAIALFFVWLIMIGVLYGILDLSGVFDRVNNAVHQLSGDGKTGNVVTGPLVFGFAIIIGVVNIVLFIALSTVGAMVYNLCADLVGGAEVTLSERE
ncbi:MAG TPA: DUF3566 domain-containing protein [Jatrophihabitans sp.]|nr:DUF3566 domain-containing protein [Jatrophihabitans sp.]